LVTIIVFSFTTDAFKDIILPKLISTLPANETIGISINSAITATFSEPMDPLTINIFTFTLKQGLTNIPGIVTYSGITAVFIPDAALSYSTEYNVLITAIATDLAGNFLESNEVWNFTTGITPDITAPSVSFTNPIKDATFVNIHNTIIATFSEFMDPLTVTILTFKLMLDDTPILGLVISTGVIATLTPIDALEYETEYTIVINSDVKDLAGNSLITNYTSSFTTDQSSLEPVDLGTASNFVILTESGITTTGTTTIDGDIGTSPIAATALTGFGLVMDPSNQFATSSIVNGKIYAADFATPTPLYLTTAVLDKETAYTNAAGRTSPDYTELGAGLIGGMTLIPGLYKWSSTVLIATNLTLLGDSNDVWIFQIAQTLTVSTAVHIILSGGVKASNIFWQVAGQTTLGTYSDFSGNILDHTAIVLNTGAILRGRAFAHTAVTLDSNAIIVPPDKIYTFIAAIPSVSPMLISDIVLITIVSAGIVGALILIYKKKN